MAQNMDKQVAKDERQLENVSVKARPMNIQGKYQDICSNEWNDAKSLLDSKRIQAGEQQKMTFLVDIFLFSLEAAEKTLSAVMENIALQVADPMCNEKSALDPYPPQHVASQLRTSQHHGGGHESGSGGAQFAMPENLENSIRDVYRTRADAVKVDKLCEVIEKKMRHNYQRDDDLNHAITQTPVITFIACATLAWKMVLQRPPMRFSVSNVGRKFHPGEEEPFWGSKDPNSENATVGYYVHPALYHKDVLMVKGKVHLVMDRNF